MLKAALIGSKGRMGQVLSGLAPEAGVEVVGSVDAGDDIALAIRDAEVAVDFSVPAATVRLVDACVLRGVPAVIGTTGLSADQQGEVQRAATQVAVVQAGNFSVGVNTLFWLVEHAARALGTDYVAEVLELHHRHKQDAPSGTAMDLATRLQRAAEGEKPLRHGREGQIGPRPDAEIGLHALRGGEVVGEHTVFFFGPHDRLELTHRAADRRIFATGALRAAHWVAKQPAGLYNMQDVLGLTAS